MDVIGPSYNILQQRKTVIFHKDDFNYYSGSYSHLSRDKRQYLLLNLFYEKMVRERRVLALFDANSGCIFALLSCGISKSLDG